MWDDQLRRRSDSPDLHALETQPIRDDDLLPKTAKREWRRILKFFILFSFVAVTAVFWFWNVSYTDPSDISLLEFTDIVPDLLTRNAAEEWSVNVPSYIIGLSRGGRGGVLGLGVTDPSGSVTSFTASECDKIEWTDHDGVSFGSQELVSKHGSLYTVKWMREEDGDVVVKISESLSSNKSTGTSYVMLSIEGLEIKDDAQPSTLALFDPFDFTKWTVSTSVNPLPIGTVSVERFDMSKPPNQWVSPSSILPYLRSADNSGKWTLRKSAQVPLMIHSMKFVFFQTSELALRIGKFSGGSKLEKFSEDKFANLVAGWRSRFPHEFARKSISQLFGNLGRFSGPLAISTSATQTVNIVQPFVSLTAIGPSRTKFSRGFLWDEGFHLLAIVRTNPNIAIEILTAWLRTQSVSAERGWIPREHALSFRDRASIPPEFLAQDPRIANPPTLIFALTYLMNVIDISDSVLVKIGGHVVRWLHHLQRTQVSTYGGGGKCFRWSLRTPEHCLSSGLDDYPRGKIVNENECHLDLHSWTMLMVRFMRHLCRSVSNSAVCVTDWNAEYMKMHANLLEIFSVPNTKFLADYVGSQSSQPGKKPVHSPHIGYINLFPLLLGHLSPSKDLEVIRGTVDLIQTHLVSPYGLLSLSRSDPQFGSGENYWKGNIWANINLLTVGSLKSYGARISDVALGKRMIELSNLLKNGWLVHAEKAWNTAGGPREYLKPEDGSGGGVYPFAGWTAASLFLLSDEKAATDFFDSIILLDD